MLKDFFNLKFNINLKVFTLIHIVKINFLVLPWQPDVSDLYDISSHEYFRGSKSHSLKYQRCIPYLILLIKHND